MKRSLYILATLAILTGCSNDPKPEYAVLESTTNTMVKPEESVKLAETTPVPAPEAEPYVLFDIMGIAGKSEAEVEATLGKPSEVEGGEWTLMLSEQKTPYKQHFYAMEYGYVKVMFIEGKAAILSVDLQESGLRYPDDAIKAMKAVGLTVEDGATPEREKPLYLDYGQVGGFYSVRVVKDVEGNPENVGYVKVVTEERYM